MKDIRISPSVQLVAILGVLAGIGALAASQEPEIRRYLKIKSM
jgi:hypothetical protein